jgi:hypothetical protein
MSEIVEHNAETGEIVIREMTEAELAQKAKDEKIYLEAKQKQKEKAEKRLALLEKLGITEEEAKLLLA